ncbi:7113_t:CDS:2 [Funneliformis geosporum]|uniref:7113_t:CDS:1 n=1 Tax=Funneliformis geosporum TaxID=1117311 RepID=A0A9W4SVN4_9GLOM|nr:7113_t:CDS:2 [Funneliformis geosporum]
MTEKNNLYNRKSQNEVLQEKNSFGLSNSVDYETKKYTWEKINDPSHESNDEDTHSFTKEYIVEQEDSLTRTSQEPSVKKIIAMARGTDSTQSEDSGINSSAHAPEDKMCRICFAGSEEEDNLGRLISPCQCKGTMRYVHVECLNHWRLQSQKQTSFFQCDECKYKYAFRRTTMAKFATNEFILTLVTLSLFAICVFLGGFLAKFFLYLFPLTEDFEYEEEIDEEVEPLFTEPITVSTIFTIDSFHILSGFLFVGLIGFVQLFFSLMWFGPIPSWSNFRIGPASGVGSGSRADGFTVFFFTIIIVLGILKATWGMYKLVRSASRKLLERIELTILEVNEA